MYKACVGERINGYNILVLETTQMEGTYWDFYPRNWVEKCEDSDLRRGTDYHKYINKPCIIVDSTVSSKTTETNRPIK